MEKKETRMRRNKTWLWCVAWVGAALLCSSARGADDEKGEEAKALKVGDKVQASGTLSVEREPEGEGKDAKKEKDRKILKATLSAEDGQTYHIILDKKGERLAKQASAEDMAGCTVQIKGKVARRPLTPKERAELRKKKKKHMDDSGEVWVKVMACRIVKPEEDEGEEGDAEEDEEGEAEGMDDEEVVE